MNRSSIFFLVLVVVGLAACTTQATPDPDPQITTEDVVSIPVKVEQVKASSEVIPLQVTGMLASQEEIRLGFKIGGIIQAVYVSEGQSVKKGQQLARLNSIEIDAQVSQAKSGVTKAERDLERVKQLYADSVATLEQVQDLTTALEVAKAGLEGAEFNQAQAVIYAPASGQILQKFGEKGEVVGPGNPIFLLASRGKNQVLRAGLSDVEIVQLNLGDNAEVSFDAYPNEQFSAQVSQIAAGADPFTGTFEVELQLTKSNKRLKNGFIGKATILPNQQVAYVRLPMQAMVEADPNQLLIYVPDASQSTAEQVFIQQYQIQDDFLAVPLSELQQQSVVITEGAKYLSPGAAIRIIREDSFAVEN